ncbi:MAG: cell division protein FtsQ/DivIB [Gammaproteobacteria bacterium]|nr:cell division protein FtsQ/DivIB [Gammaproteobacteria bacterium]
MRATRTQQASPRRSETARREQAAKKRRAWLRTSFWGVFLPLLAVAGLVSALPHAWAFLHNPEVFPIKRLAVSGNLHYVADDWLRQTVRQASAKGFFGVDVPALRERICGQDWVADCQVQKTWPDKVHVAIVEHKPVALWGEHQLINENGALFTLKNTAPTDLPRLAGPAGQAERVLKEFRALSERFKPHGLSVAALRMNEREAWQFRLQDGVLVHIGREDYDNRVERFLVLYPRLKNDPKRAVETIDLRYDTGVAVGWKAEPKISEDMDARIATLTNYTGH